jgi:hypothetical protein
MSEKLRALVTEIEQTHPNIESEDELRQIVWDYVNFDPELCAEAGRTLWAQIRPIKPSKQQ